MPAILRTGDWLGSGVQSSLTFSANEANFRKRSQLPQTKPTGKTIVKTMFEHEQHNAWPNEPDRSATEESILAKRTQGGASSGRYFGQTRIISTHQPTSS
jgi:hypothetical protein